METKILSRYFRYLIFTVLFSLIIVYLFKQLLDNPIFTLSAQKVKVQQSSIADSYVSNADIVSFSVGEPQYYFNSTQIIHYPGEKESTALQPRIKGFNKKNTPWIVSAKHAWLSADTTQIRMEKDVLVKQLTSELETEILWIWPKKEYVETDQAVRITTEQSLITAVGMNANLQSKQYHLLNNVHVTLKPK
ncbi:MAG: LPS export ABC transporter periplasmic protein LptC [Pseudomonadota bacterium]